MPFIPHTAAEVVAMLDAVGAESIEQLFDEIPPQLRAGELSSVPDGRGEMAVLRLMGERARKDQLELCFLGAGCYDHHIPSAVWDIAQRGEFLTAYTPYQAEASQGTLQLIYEYQSMMTELTAMDVSNASVYDGASGLAEAVLMAVRANRKNKSRRVLMTQTVNPLYRQTVATIVRNQGIVLDSLPMTVEGVADLATLNESAEPPVALVVQQPNFFGLLEQVDELTDWAAAHDVLVIAVVNPTSLALLKPPGQWGEGGTDIACGDGQPLGVPMASGGPSFGFICTRSALVRQLPGRIIGRTEDLDGGTGFTLTLQAREQHIRRAKATSNICTNQGLLVTAATIYLSLLGPAGLEGVAGQCHRRVAQLTDAATTLPGVTCHFAGPFFHERVLALPCEAGPVAEAMADRGILAGLPLGEFYPELSQCLLVCGTEKHSDEDIERYLMELGVVLSSLEQKT
jgi:glycine dehydrogenase subunit 1